MCATIKAEESDHEVAINKTAADVGFVLLTENEVHK